MEKNRVLFEALEGRDELGIPKAACSLTIQRIIAEDDTEVVQSVSTQDAEVSVYSTPLLIYVLRTDWIMITFNLHRSVWSIWNWLMTVRMSHCHLYYHSRHLENIITLSQA